MPLKNALKFLLGLIDPDTNWRSFSTFQHFAGGGVGFMSLFNAVLHYSIHESFLFTLCAAVYYEIAQTDSVYSLGRMIGQKFVGLPGFGFGLMDIAASVVGAGVYVVIHAVWLQ